MKIFHCSHCENPVVFENYRCLRCGHLLAFLPDLGELGALAEGEAGRYSFRARGGERKTYRLCDNYSRHNVCNWAVPAEDPRALCRSCRLTRVIPDLSWPGNLEAWYRIEVAKRRLVYTLDCLGLPVTNRVDDPQRGLAFEFLADPTGPGAASVLTGHNQGVITLNIAEADDAEREKRRLQMREPYRTLLGHFRHESGHYYWDRLIRDGARLDGFRERFGDERDDYQQALQRHYQQGPPVDWSERFVSAYASSHAWEDWAETWAHYLHMVDTVELAIQSGLSLQPRRPNERTLHPDQPLRGCRPASFDALVEAWFPLTYILNNLNRGLGLADVYPFVLSPSALAKLRFVHEVVGCAT